MSKLYTLAEATKIANISRKLMHKLIEKQFVIPEHLAGQLFFSESEINKLKAMIEENKLKPDTSKSDKMLHEFSSISDFFPRDDRLLEETNDILFQLQVLKNLSTQAHLVLYQNMINPSKFLYVIEENQITYTPIGLDKTTVDNIYLIKSKRTKIEVQDICCEAMHKKGMRNFLAGYFYRSHASSMNNADTTDRFPLLFKVVNSINSFLSKVLRKKKNADEQQNESENIFEYENQRATVYIIKWWLRKVYIDRSYVRNKLLLPLLGLDDHIFSEALKKSLNSIDLELLKRKMKKYRYDAVCPIHGPIKVVVGGMISPPWTWKYLCGRHWEFLLCPHCFFTFNQNLIRMN